MWLKASLHTVPQVDQHLVIGVRTEQAFTRVFNIENDKHCNHGNGSESEDMEPTPRARTLSGK